MEKSPANLAVPSAGTVIAGKYRLLAPVAEGGMGAVWRAEDLRLAAPVAVKLLHARHLHDAESRARFHAEAAIGAQLRSPHVVQIFEMGVDGGTGLPFISMELLEGESLQERLVRAGPLPAGELLRVLSQVARALTRAHALGIIHRDLKPANIFLVHDGETQLAKVLDFGIAKRVADASGRQRTLTGDLLGTPTYMSPEQIMGSRSVDHRSDLWSLAVIAVECLTGKLPFDADHLAGLALAICQGRHTLPSSLGSVPPGFDAWFQKAAASHPEGRFESAAQLIAALRRVFGEPPAGDELANERAAVGAATVAAPPSHAGTATPAPPERTVQLLRPEQLRRRQTRRRRLVASVAAGVLLVWLALNVRLPERAPSPAAAGAESVVLSSAPPPSPAAATLPAGPVERTSSLTKPEPELEVAPGQAGAAGRPAPQSTPVLTQPVRPPPPRRPLPVARDPVAGNPAALQPRAPRPPPAADPDNLGF